MPNTIKVKRGKSAALNSSTEKLQAGEVLYNLDKNYLTVGAKDNDALTKKPVAAREIVGYTGDTNDKIGTSTTEAYSIRYDDDSGVVVSSENNILSTPGTVKMQTPGKNASTITIRTGEVDPDGSAKPTIELSTSLSMPLTLALPWKSGTLATTDDITTSIATKLDNTNEDKVALKNNKSLSYTSEATASTIMSRDTNGAAEIEVGTTDKSIINKSFADGRYSQATNINNGSGDKSLQQTADPKKNGKLKFPESSLYAKVLDPTLTLDSEPIGGQADFSVSLGGNSSAQAKRAIAGGTTTVARGPYSTVFGDNCVTLAAGSDSLAHGYQTVTDAPASHTEGSYTVVMNQKYVEGMFDPSTEPGQPGQPTEPSETPADTLSMDTRRGEAGHASGFNSYVSGFAGYTDGVSNVADGHISKASGRSNRAWSYLSKVDGYQSVVKPDDTDKDATGEGSWANGNNVQIIGAKYAYSGGTNNFVSKASNNSFSYGTNLNVNGENQCIVGQYNSNDLNSIFEVGTGNSTSRHTAFRVTKDGKVYYDNAEIASLIEVDRRINAAGTSIESKINDVANSKLDRSGGVLTGTVYLTNGGMRIGTNSIALGDGIKDGHLYLGTYNEGSESNIFEVGSGADSTHRVNALSVTSAGQVQIANAPKDDNDIVRLKELKEKQDKLDPGVNLVGTDGITIDKATDSEKIEISGKNLIKDPHPGRNDTGADIIPRKFNNENSWGIGFLRNTHALVNNAESGSIVGYDNNGVIYAKTVSDDDWSVVNKKYADENYRKVVTGTSNEIKVYVTKYGDTESWMFLNTDPDGAPGAEIPQYGTGGTLRANMPETVLDNSVVNKKYADGRYVKNSENFVKAFTIPNGASSGTLTADVKEKLCNPDGYNYYVYDTTSEMILKYSFNEENDIIQYKAIYLINDKAYEITMQIFPSNGKWTRSQTILKGVTANPTLTGTEDELTGLKVGGTDYKISVTKEYVDDGFVRKVTGSSQVYSKGSDGVDGSIGYSQSPANSAITQYTSSGTLRTNNPTEDLDAVNKTYGESNYYQLTEGKTVSSSDTIDLNTYKTAGTYNLPASPKTNTPPDVGSATPGKLIVEYLYDNEHIIQSFYSLSNVGKQYRRVFDAMWSDWEELATTGDINNKKVFSVTIYEAGD